VSGEGDVPYTDGEPDEALLAAAGAFELEALGSGQSCNATYELAGGEYTLFCIVRTDDGQTHSDRGMKSTLSVTENSAIRRPRRPHQAIRLCELHTIDAVAAT
jgi:hypothetical protein